MEILNTKTLPGVANGLLEAAIDEALYEVFEDLKNRPCLKTARKVTIELTFRPVVGDRRVDNGVVIDKTDQFEAADIQFSAQPKIPKSTFQRRMLAVSRSNGFGFESDTNSIKFHPDQRPLGFPDEELVGSEDVSDVM